MTCSGATRPAAPTNGTVEAADNMSRPYKWGRFVGAAHSPASPGVTICRGGSITSRPYKSLVQQISPTSPLLIEKKTLPSAPSLAPSRGAPAEPPSIPAPTGPAPAASAPVVPSSPSLPTWRCAGPLVRLCFHLPLYLAMVRHTGQQTAWAGRRRTGASEPPQVAVAAAATPDTASSHRSTCAPGLDETSKP